MKINAKFISILCVCGMFFFYSCDDDDKDEEYNNIENGTDNQSDTIQSLYQESFINSNFSNWTNSKAWTSTSEGARLKTDSTSYLKNYYSVNQRCCKLQFKPSEDCQFTLGIDNEINETGSAFWSAVVDAKNQVVEFAGIKKDFVLDPNHTYELNLKTYDLNNTLSIADLDSSENHLEFDSFSSFTCDFYGIKMQGGTSPLFKSIKVEAPKNPFVIFIGNSITFGIGSSFENGHPTGNFGTLAGKASGKKYLISGRCGNTITQLLGDNKFNGRVDSEIKPLKPKYVVITIGTNGGNTYENLSELVTKIIEYGSTPILNNVPFVSFKQDGNWVALDKTEDNKLIDKIRSVYKLNGAHLNYATSLNGDGNAIDTTLYNEEPAWGTTVIIHPNNEGHKAIAEQIKKDCPELFQ